MNTEQRMKNLSVPKGKIDVVLDTDAYNEIDDQFAIAYLLASKEKLCTKAIYAAPFLNSKSKSPKDGMEKSYDEILKLLDLIKTNIPVFKGSENYLKDEKTPQISDSATDLVKRAKEYSPKKPLYVIAIGAITNIASALLQAPEIAENIVVVWLGGHARHFCDTKEFNMEQDIPASRVVMKSKAPFVQLPCCGVVSGFSVSGVELECFLKGKNKLCDYLLANTVKEVEKYVVSPVWTRIIWDVTAVAWLLNDNDRFMLSSIEKMQFPDYENKYVCDINGEFMRYVYYIKRDELLRDLIEKITSFK